MKKVFLIGLAVATLASTVGCSGIAVNEQVSEPAAVGEAAEADPNKADAQKMEDRIRMGPADIAGKVSRIVGNEVTINLIEMPEIDVDAKKGSGSQVTQERGQGAPTGGAMPEAEYTGETKVVTIPVGIPISSRSKEGSQELDISDISAGMMIMIWTNDSGDPIRVQFMGVR